MTTTISAMRTSVAHMGASAPRSSAWARRFSSLQTNQAAARMPSSSVELLSPVKDGPHSGR